MSETRELVVEAFANVAEAKKRKPFFDWCSDDPFEGGPVGIVWRKAECHGATGMPGNAEVSLADAQRLAASWNALAGIPTASLQGGVIAELIAAARGMEQEVTTALARGQVNPRPDSALCVLRAVLARLKGWLIP